MTRRGILLAILAVLTVVYTAVAIWPTRYRYDHLGATPVRWDRLTDQMQFLNFHGWQDALPAIGDEKRP